MNFSAPIWDERVLGTDGASRLPAVTDVVQELVDEFANDYLTANPKQ